MCRYIYIYMSVYTYHGPPPAQLPSHFHSPPPLLPPQLQKSAGTEVLRIEEHARAEFLVRQHRRALVYLGESAGTEGGLYVCVAVSVAVCVTVCVAVCVLQCVSQCVFCSVSQCVLSISRRERQYREWSMYTGCSERCSVCCSERCSVCCSACCSVLFPYLGGSSGTEGCLHVCVAVSFAVCVAVSVAVCRSVCCSVCRSVCCSVCCSVCFSVCCSVCCNALNVSPLEAAWLVSEPSMK